MVGKLFAEGPPALGARLLDCGCGDGVFIAGVLRRCRAQGWHAPEIVGVELDPLRAGAARDAFRGHANVTICQQDFLSQRTDHFDYVIGNPPYVSILELSPAERLVYRVAFQTARGRFDLYALFFEQAMRLLRPNGRLVFITPEKFLYVETARPLRELMRSMHVEEFSFLDEDTFPDRVVYPLITTLVHRTPRGRTRVRRRDGTHTTLTIASADSLMASVQGFSSAQSQTTLADISLRISCGVATGADSEFVVPTRSLPDALREYAHPTVAGRQILPSGEMIAPSSMLAPYDQSGALLPEHRLGALGDYLREPDRRARLAARSCTRLKPWYAFHDSFPLEAMRRPKLLCKDITESPFFVTDSVGLFVPRHSVYYIVPNNPSDIAVLAEYLNSEAAVSWLRAHCQRAAGGFLRLQSHVLKQLPVPEHLAGELARQRANAPLLELLPA